MATSLLHAFRAEQSNKYLLYIPDCRAVREAGVAHFLQNALIVAYGHDPSLLAEIDRLHWSLKALTAWMDRRARNGDRFYFIVDQFHSLTRAVPRVDPRAARNASGLECKRRDAGGMWYDPRTGRIRPSSLLCKQ